jgi:3-isopropylmalate dehydrogenase
MSLNKNIAVIMGEGIGPEITTQAIRVLDTIASQYGHTFKYNYINLENNLIEPNVAVLSNESINICKRSDAVLLGPTIESINDSHSNWKIKFKQELELFATIRPVASFGSLHHLAALKSSVLNVANLVVYREIEGGKISFSNNIEYERADLIVYKTAQIERIAELAYKHAQKRRKKITVLHKSDQLDISKLWLTTMKNIALNYEEIETEFLHIEEGSIKLITNPAEFDVILTDNIFGDIISSISSSIAGSRGMLPSASIGEKNAVFETVLGACQDITGKDIANPIGSILSAAMMLRHFGLKNEVEKIIHAVEWTVEHGFITKDIDPVNFYFTTTIGEMICDHIQNNFIESVHMENIQLRKSTII